MLLLLLLSLVMEMLTFLSHSCRPEEDERRLLPPLAIMTASAGTDERHIIEQKMYCPVTPKTAIPNERKHYYSCFMVKY